MGTWELKTYGLLKFDWGLVISKYWNICKKLLTIWAVPSNAIFWASSARNLWFVNDRSYLHFVQIPECHNFNWQICIWSYLLETFIADTVVIWERDLCQIGCFVDFIYHSYVGFVVDNLMVSVDWEIPQYFCWVIFSYLCWLMLVPWYVFLDKPMLQ